MGLEKRGLQILFIFIAGILLGVLLAAFSPGEFLSGAWQSALYCILLAALFFIGWFVIKPPKIVLILAICAFLLRIGVGIWLTTTLPVNGFDTTVQNAGYTYSDAYDRDQLAYAIAFPGKEEFVPPANINAVDQYGGMMMLSTGIYRLFSTDVHRPLLIIFLSALSMALAVIFTWKAIHLVWGEKTALVAVIFLVFYPEGVILGSAQMREPLLICLALITFWAMILFTTGERRLKIIAVFALAALLMCWISIPAGLVIIAVELGYLQVKAITTEKEPGRKKGLLIVFGVFLLLVCLAGWMWLKNTLYYDAFATESESGLISWLLSLVGSKWRFPFVLLYGLIQPVLPAALVYQSLPVWQGIAIFRASGWYFTIPFLIYGIGAVIKEARKNGDWALVWLMAVLVIWTFISSARAGGDQWDNPRYRAILLPWLSLLIGWVWDRVSQGKVPWFWRIVVLDGAFVLIFTNWYFNRKFGTGIAIPTEYDLGLFVVLLIAVIAGGILFDRRKQKTKTGGGKENI
jgi:hypothetical protein